MKIGITIENLNISKTTRIILNELLNHKNNFKIFLVNIQFDEKQKNIFSFERKYLYFVEKFLNFLLKILNFLGFYSFNKELVLLNDDEIINSCEEIINVSQSRKGYYSYTSTKNLEKYNLDFIVRGNGLLIEHGEILDTGHNYGLISLHHSDNRHYRGGPWGFWEVFYNDEMSGITLQKLTKELDGGVILGRASLETKINWRENQKNLDLYSGKIIVKFLKDFKITRSFEYEKEIYKTIYINNVFRLPSMFNTTVYLFNTILKYFFIVMKRFKNIITKRISSRYLQDYWFIHVGKKSERVNKWQNSLKHQNDFWLADPFLINIEKQNFLICESFNIKNNIASIVYFKFINDEVNFEKPYELICNGNHLSYPFTFKRNNRTFCIPEAGDDGIWLYELILNNNKLVAKKIKCILEGNYVDPTLINLDGVDYLFVNPQCPSNPRSILEIFYSDDITTKKIMAHPKNPVLIDSRFSRSAGRIQKIGDKLVRTSQNCNKVYGNSLDFSQITIDKKNFKSVHIDSISGLDPKSQIHHLEFMQEKSDSIIAIDSNYYTVKS